MSKTELEGIEKEELKEEVKEERMGSEQCDYLVKTGLEEGEREGQGYKVGEIEVFEGYFQFEYAAA